MALQDYSVITLFYNGGQVKQLTRIKRMLNADNQPLQLLNEGLGGFTPGSGVCTVEWDAPVPIGGTEYPYEEDAAARAYVALQVFVGRRSYAGLGKIQTVDTEGSAGQASSISISWTGEFKPTA